MLPGGFSLRERLKNSNCILLKIPTEITTIEHGEMVTCMDEDRLSQEFDLTAEDVENLGQAGLIRRRPQRPRPKQWIDYAVLQ